MHVLYNLKSTSYFYKIVIYTISLKHRIFLETFSITCHIKSIKVIVSEAEELLK